MNELPARWRRRSVPILGLIVAVGTLAACSLLLGATPDPRTERQKAIDAQAATWLAAGIDDYTFRVSRGCFCPPEAIGPFLVTVEGDATVQVSFDGAQVGPAAIPGVPLTIEAAFALLRALPREGEAKITWDPALGFPAEAVVDPVPNAVDDEFTLTITELRPSR